MAGCRLVRMMVGAGGAAATSAVGPARELTVQVLDDVRGTGLGTRLLDAFEGEARVRGCSHVFTTSTFQAPGFYRRRGYREQFRWEDLPTRDAADVHLRKEL